MGTGAGTDKDTNMDMDTEVEVHTHTVAQALRTSRQMFTMILLAHALVARTRVYRHGRGRTCYVVVVAVDVNLD